MRVFARCSLLLPLVLIVSACGGQVVSNENLRDIDTATFDGHIVSYFLPRAELTVTAAYDPEKDTLTITRSEAPKIVPDVERHFHAVYRHNEFSSDEITIQTDANGLLKQISTTSTDQTAAIIKKIGEIGQEYGSLREAQKSRSAAAADAAPKGCAALNATVTADVTYTKGRPKSLAPSDNRGCQLSLSVTVVRKEALDNAAYPATALQSERKPDGCPKSAICFRSMAGFQATISATLKKSAAAKEATGKDDITAKQKFTFAAPSAGRTGVLFFNRRAFVTNTTTAEFENGVLTKLSAKDPSAVAAALEIPIEILKSLTIFVKIK